MTPEQQISAEDTTQQTVTATSGRKRAVIGRLITPFVPPSSNIALEETSISNEYFEEPICRNCGHVREDKYCGHCGQKKAQRFSFRDVGQEFWQLLRLFEMGLFHTILRLAKSPGKVAREYVFGAHNRHTHPYKLLLVAEGFLILMLNQTNFLTAGQDDLSPMLEQIQDWSQLSFSLGLFAIMLSSYLAFFRQQGYNLIEHLVLAIYTHTTMIGANLLNMIPLMFKEIPEQIISYRNFSQNYMEPIEGVIVFVAFQQFFRVDWRRNGWRLLLAVALYYLLKHALILLYARLLVWLVLGV